MLHKKHASRGRAKALPESPGTAAVRKFTVQNQNLGETAA
jgi:hypothetical protein